MIAGNSDDDDGGSCSSGLMACKACNKLTRLDCWHCLANSYSMNISRIISRIISIQHT